MKLKNLLADVAVLHSTADPETEIRDISFDSRGTRPGDLFVAVRGYESDGHRFIPMAAEKGAAAVLCEEPPENGAPYVLVADSRLALAQVSAAYFGHPARELRLVGVTGTNGKTTTTTLLKHVLEQAGYDPEFVRRKITDAYRESVVNAVNSALRRIDVAKVVEDKINSMAVEELEKGVLTVMKTELNLIVSLGALIGLVIGSINIFLDSSKLDTFIEKTESKLILGNDKPSQML